jgi:hypothetical protein
MHRPQSFEEKVYEKVNQLLPFLIFGAWFYFWMSISPPFRLFSHHIINRVIFDNDNDVDDDNDSCSSGNNRWYRSGVQPRHIF